MRNLRLLTFLIVAMTVLSGCQRTEPARLGHVYGKNHPIHVAGQELAHDMEQCELGEILVRPGASSGHERQLLDALAVGTMELAVVSMPALVAWASDVAVADRPYRFASLAEMHATLARPDDDALALLRERGVDWVDWWYTGPRGVLCATQAYVVPPPAGVRVALHSSDPRLRLLGDSYTLCRLPVRKRYDALRDGAVAAIELDPWLVLEFRAWNKACCYVRTRHTWGPAALLVRRSWAMWQQPAGRRGLLRLARAQREHLRWRILREVDWQCERLRQQGMNIVEADAEAWRNAVPSAP